MSLTRRNLLLSLAVLVVGGCKIVGNEDLKASKAEFDGAAYVDKIWTSKALPDFKNRAKGLDEILQEVAKDPDHAGQAYGHREGEGNPWTYVIEGEGRIVAVDTASRHGIVTVEVQTSSGTRKVDLQLGPVVFGTMLRDALPFIKFGDFVNQIQYAQVSRALNDRATKDIRESFDSKDAMGKSIRFLAAAVLSGGDPINATPVSIEPVKAGNP